MPNVQVGSLSGFTAVTRESPLKVGSLSGYTAITRPGQMKIGSLCAYAVALESGTATMTTDLRLRHGAWFNEGVLQPFELV